MKKNNFFEKFGKLIISLLLTWFLVTGVVIAATNFTNWSILDADDLNAEFTWKVSKSDLPACLTWESLTYDGTSFSCFTPEKATNIEMPQAGMAYNGTFASKTVNITFPTAFSSTPQIVVAMNGFYLENSSRGERFELYPTYSNVTKNWFKLTIPWSTHNNHKLKAASVSWFAMPASWTWSSPSMSNITASCQSSQRTTNNEKTWSCVKWSYSNTYYGWESTCMWDFGPPDWEGFPTMRSGYKYSKKYTQTCN